MHLPSDRQVCHSYPVSRHLSSRRLSRLADRAPPDDPLEFAVIPTGVHPAKESFEYRGPAAETRLRRPTEDVVAHSGPPVAGEEPTGFPTVLPHHLPGQIEQAGRGNLCLRPAADGTAWVHATEVTDFRPVLVADSGDITLVEQRRPDATVRAREDSSQCFITSERRALPVRREDVRPEMAHDLVVVVTVEEPDESETVADGLDLRPSRMLRGQPQDDPRGVTGPAPPGSGGVDGPDSLHLQVGVQDTPVEVHEEMLAVGPHPGDLPTGEVLGGEAGYTDV
ncbi:hypothetical protein BJF89_13360 [Corynebacterium sp. CNJ-954]|nr:hypothetical protein BJF89_13360 [Corynebacterium sp. CNJ-954]